MDKQTNGNNKNNEQLGYLFNVEILVKSSSNALALQSLLQLLNEGEQIIDYRINSGIELGEIIESLLAARKQSFISRSYKRLTASNSQSDTTETTPGNAKSEDKPADVPGAENNFAAMAKNRNFQDWIQKYISENRLVRILINRNGERINIPCRILNFQSETYTINVYHVDEKQVYTFMLSEIIDFIET